MIDVEPTIAQQLEHSCEQLGSMTNAWRAFFLIDGSAWDAQKISAQLPWASTQRANTITRVFQFPRGMALVSGGLLSDDEGRLLFGVHRELGAKAIVALVVPPTSAAVDLVNLMYERRCLPVFPTGQLPNARGYWALATFFLLGTLYAVRFLIRVSVALREDVWFALGSVLTGAVLTAVAAWFGWRTRKRFTAAISDPARIANSCWGYSVPSPPRQELSPYRARSG
jgi:hypothetical protein